MKCPYCDIDLSPEVAAIHIPFCKEIYDPSEPETQSDLEVNKTYAEMTIKELKAELDKREIEYDSKGVKESFIDLLEFDDLEDEHYE